MFITRELLKEMPSGKEACIEARLWFDSNFPNGGELSAVWKACNNDEWRVWFACHYLPKEAQQELAWKFAGQAMRNAGIEAFADNVNDSNWQKAKRTAAQVATVIVTDVDARTFTRIASAYKATHAAAVDVHAAARAAAYAAAAAGDITADIIAARKEQAEWAWEVLQDYLGESQ